MALFLMTSHGEIAEAAQRLEVEQPELSITPTGQSRSRWTRRLIAVTISGACGYFIAFGHANTRPYTKSHHAHVYAV